MMVSSINIIGDSGTEYKISVDPVTSVAKCSCPAYRFAQGIKICKHIGYVADAFAAHHD